MISQTKNRVQAIKSKFETLNCENEQLIVRKSVRRCQQENSDATVVLNKESVVDQSFKDNSINDINECSPQPNTSYLYSQIEPKRVVSEVKKTLTRQTSDPGKKLHRSHAFRCDRSQKIQSPKRHGSCNGRSESVDFTLKMGEKKLSKERLKQLGNLLEDHMRKENFVPPKDKIVGIVTEVQPSDSIPDKDVPQHILDQYAKVVKPKKNEEKQDKQDAMTDSGVSSETENLDEEKTGKIKKLMSQFEKTEPEIPDNTNLEVMNDLCASSETMKLERKNPHLTLTDTLKKALKQPLPSGPPPKKPPRTFAAIPENPEKQKKDTKKMLEKLEQVLHKREAQNKNIYDIAETDLSKRKPKEMHYLCTEILDINQRTLPNQNNTEPIKNCFDSLNCTVLRNSTASLPYTRLSTCSSTNSELTKACSCNNNLEGKRLSSFFPESGQDRCSKCLLNDEKEHQFKCHLNCKCKEGKSEFYVEKEHIYDEPFNDDVLISVNGGTLAKKSQYGTLNMSKLNGNHSKSLEDLKSNIHNDDTKIYDIPCDMSRPATPQFTTSSPKSEFQKLRENFENGFQTENRNSNTENRNSRSDNELERKEISERKKRSLEISETRISPDKPTPLTPKPNLFIKKVSRSSENLVDELKNGKVLADKKFATETKRYRSRTDAPNMLSLPKKNCSQLDVDRENLNRLMNEIYETVTAACNMDDRKPGSFPTDHSDGSTSEDSVKLTRSVTEKRKNYVRRVSSRVAYLDQANVKKVNRFRHQTSICSYKSEIIENPYITFRSWKSFRASRSNLQDKMADCTDSKINLTDSTGNMLSMKDEFDDESIDKMSIDEKTGCVDIELPFEPREKGLFNVCLLVGLNYMSGEAYVKNIFPSQVQLPPHIENLIFPETLSWPAGGGPGVGGGAGSGGAGGEWSAEARDSQCYSLVLTDERGERSYGYCRRVLPEGASTCLPLCYCIIGKYRAPGFYYKVLQEIESHHGSSEEEINSILQQLFEVDFPSPGEEISVTYRTSSDYLTDKGYRTSANLADSKSKTLPDLRRSNEPSDLSLSECNDLGGSERADLPFLDLENNNRPKRIMLNVESQRTRTIKRPIEPRADETSLTTLLDAAGAGLLVKIFGSLLLERKMLVASHRLSIVSSCMEALQSALYPFVWQQPLIAIIPGEIQRDVLQAPLPILAGMLRGSQWPPTQLEEGMLIDISEEGTKALFYQGDESTILPTTSYKTLKTALQMESSKHKDRTDDIKTRNLMISESFLRFFVEILGDFWNYFSVGELKEGDFGKAGVKFDKEAYIKNVTSKQNQYFLEWFTETAMFNHFIQNMCVRFDPHSSDWPPVRLTDGGLVDTPTPNFYQLFDERVASRNTSQKNLDKVNYKSAVNKKMRILKTKLRDLIT